ncbi:DNA-3-methyladenine glycosylase [Orlajensenia leifsoniae]|uniref:Putative 3-methyladenine DNA glycosylase n=1 Tax=Orlajensenia leifsoniae TaxID=2561933 RepID=A0A4Y9QXB7_9MICO|nr:DNA-3-methyladenine glycosylase [Leifsonia flava]TFV97071.1 DNA-3-methyladenine glycosylase [Leifsonia flava]
MLDRAALSRDAVELAPELLGALLTHRTSEGDVTVRLTEVEAYRGTGEDPGSHAHRGMTPRTTVMFGEPGHLYAYFTYGMHTCVNIVCSPAGSASALLLRAGEIVDGVELARRRRPSAASDRDLARGPARLASALGIPLAENGADLFSDPFALRGPDAAPDVARGPRVGVSGAGGGAAYPWRFWIPGDPTVSVYRRHARSHD